jgi:hypothetical protein
MLNDMKRMPNARKPLKAPGLDPQERQVLPGRPTSMSSGGQVFLSYSRDDRDYVSRLAEWLEGHGVKVWFDRDIDYGSKWEAEVQTQIDASAAILVVMSKSARRKNWVRRELDRAKKRKILILPLLLELDGIVDCVADLQFENVIGGQMPGLRLCQKLPGFLVSEMDISNALTIAQRDIARHMISAAGGALKLGSKGPGVAALQAELLRVGLAPGPIDGAFGQETAGAVREFQRRRCHMPTADGIVGPLTWMILTNSSLGDLAPATQSLS